MSHSAGDEYFLDVNVARGLVAAFEAVTKVWQYPDDQLIRCRSVKAPVVTDDDSVLAMFDLFLPDGRSAEVDMVGTLRKHQGPVWRLKEARFFLPCVCGRIHDEALIQEDGSVLYGSSACTLMKPAALELAKQAS